MLKCITFDGDASTLDTLMSYFEKLDKALADVHEVLHKETAELPVFVKEGTRIIRLKKFEESLTDGSFCRVHRSYIVSLPQISYIERKRIKIGNDLIPISESYMPAFLDRLSLQE
ncbi:MAG: LytTR family transcriptional regulator DNA-binding domain-containing protein [Macellibacteroides fermentans]|uniref:LytTR family transcriptional regulator DNA-binding domain-containing protein n=1 Tax=Macellibacteroides fermentans TaxID=879969 RepID=UPI003B6E0EF2